MCVDSIRTFQKTPNAPFISSSQAQPSINQGAYASISPGEFVAVPGDTHATDDLTSISQMFLDQNFLDRDRVISYDEGLFTADMSWWGSGS